MNQLQETDRASRLRSAIESLINAKLLDAMHPGGMQRLAAHRATGAASSVVREAEKQLETALLGLLPATQPQRSATRTRQPIG